MHVFFFFFWDPCALKIFVERCFWELKMLFGSLVELHTWLHSCLYFSPLENCFEKLAQHLLDTSLIASYLSSFRNFFLSQSRQHLDTWWIDQESLWPLDSSSTPSGSIEHHILLLVFFFLDSFSTRDLSTLLFLDTFSTDVSTPTRQMSWHQLNTSSVENYWWSINSPCAICSSFLSISLSILQTFHLPILSYSLQTSSLWILKLSSSFPSLGKCLISFMYMHLMF